KVFMSHPKKARLSWILVVVLRPRESSNRRNEIVAGKSGSFPGAEAHRIEDEPDDEDDSPIPGFRFKEYVIDAGSGSRIRPAVAGPILLLFGGQLGDLPLPSPPHSLYKHHPKSLHKSLSIRHFERQLAGILPPASQLSLKRINGAEGHFCCRVDIRNDRLQLQEIFPSTLFVSFGVRLVTHDATIPQPGVLSRNSISFARQTPAQLADLQHPGGKAQSGSQATHLCLGHALAFLDSLLN